MQLAAALSGNPQMAQVVQMAQSSGNAQQLFYQMAQAQGINPKPVLQMAKQMFGN